MQKLKMPEELKEKPKPPIHVPKVLPVELEKQFLKFVGGEDSSELESMPTFH